MQFTIFSLAAIIAATAASTSPAAANSGATLQRRANILEFDCTKFPNVCKTQCYGNLWTSLCI
jgi:hypothetical protein